MIKHATFFKPAKVAIYPVTKKQRVVPATAFVINIPVDAMNCVTRKKLPVAAIILSMNK